MQFLSNVACEKALNDAAKRRQTCSHTAGGNALVKTQRGMHMACFASVIEDERRMQMCSDVAGENGWDVTKGCRSWHHINQATMSTGKQVGPKATDEGQQQRFWNFERHCCLTKATIQTKKLCCIRQLLSQWQGIFVLLCRLDATDSQSTE